MWIFFRRKKKSRGELTCKQVAMSEYAVKQVKSSPKIDIHKYKYARSMSSSYPLNGPRVKSQLNPLCHIHTSFVTSLILLLQLLSIFVHVFKEARLLRGDFISGP